MAYFPFFVDIENKNCLVVGGGIVALRKIEKLKEFSPEITIVSDKICAEIKRIEGLILIERQFEDDDLYGKDFVIAATDNNQVNARVFELCSKRNIPVNTVDDKEKCSFIFPALVHKNSVSVGISTGGKSPLLAKKLRKKVSEILDDDFLAAVDFLANLRDFAKAELDNENMRKAAFERIYEEYTQNKSFPDEERVKLIFKEVKESGI